MANKELKVSAEEVIQAYGTSDEKGRKMLEGLFGKEVFTASIMDRVKTFEDACSILGDDHPYVCQYNFIASELDSVSPDVEAYMKLRIITAALNEGWEPVFDGKQYHYEVWLDVYTKKQWEQLSEETRKSGVLFGGLAHYGADAGFVYASSDLSPSFTSAYLGSRLCYKNREIALYSGKQFIDIWADYFLK